MVTDGPERGELAPLPPSVLEERLRVEEERLCRDAQALERQIKRLAEHKAAAKAARERAEAQQAAEVDTRRWQQELRAEVERAVARLQQQRASQLEQCAAFEAQLAHNIAQMQTMQLNVRRRAAALDTAFDASVQRLNTLYAEAVARRRSELQPSSAGAAQ